MRVLGAAITLFFTLSGQAANRNPWDLTVEERLALRLDPHAAAARLRAHVEDVGNQEGSRTQFIIDGARNPEVFLPSELMSFLLTDRMAGNNAVSRYEPVLESLHWDAARFWSDLDAAASEYLALLRDADHAARSEAVSRQLCATRVVALSRMRQKYARFDEFLYRAVAAATTLAGDRPATREWLLWMERGCE